MLGEQVAQMAHAQLRVVDVFAVGEALDDFGEIVEGLEGRARVALRRVPVDVTLGQALAGAEVHQAAQVIGIGHVRMGRIELHETIEGRNRRARFIGLVVAVGQFELGLLSVDTERIARL